MSARAKLLNKVRMCYFAMVDASLYLDSHPDCKDALSFFEKHKKLYNQAKTEYEENYAPLDFESGAADNGWAWAKEPWPWEGDED